MSSSAPPPSARPARLAARSVAALLCAGVLGCTNIGPAPQMAQEALGPFPADYERIVREWIESSFFDVSSIEGFRVRRPTPGFARAPFGDARYGWWTEVAFRPRDMLGAPKGRLSYAVLIRDGAVVAHQKRL